MNALVTGGTSAIGAAIIRLVAAAGLDVWATATSREGCVDRPWLPDLPTGRRLRFRFESAAADLADLDAPLSQMDVLILNAFPPSPALLLLHEQDPGVIGRYVGDAVDAHVRLLHAILPGMVARGFGRIVFISSLSADAGTSRYAAYCAAKAAVEGLIRNIAVDYGGLGVCANILRPGIIRTGRHARFSSRPSYEQRVAAVIPSGRLGEPDEVAAIIAPLIARACYVNGAVIPITGGLPSLRPTRQVRDGSVALDQDSGPASR